MPLTSRLVRAAFLITLYLGFQVTSETWAADQEEAQDRALRSEFLKQVEATRNLAQQKEYWFKVFAGLERSADKARKLVEDFESKMIEARGNGQHRKARYLQRKMVELNWSAAMDEVLKQYAVRQFALIQGLEDLDQSVKTRRRIGEVN